MKQRLLSSSFKYRQQDPDYKGQAIDQDLNQGPVQYRSCTDLLCCIIFIIFLGLMVYIAIIGFQTGNPQLLASPFDEDKNHCGFQAGFQQYKKVYISNFKNNPSNISFVCVIQCPTAESSKLLCHQNNIVTSCDLLSLYDSQTIVNVCVPKVQVNFDFQKFNLTVLQQYFSDLRDGRYMVLAIFGVAFIVSIIYSLLMRCFAGCFLWGFIILFITLLLLVGSVSLAMPEVQFLRQILNYDSLPDNLKNRDYQIACGCICLGSALIVTLIVCCMKRQIKISIGIIKAASDFIRQCCSSFLLPIYISILQALFIAFWIVVMLYLFSSSEDMEPIDKTPFSMIVWNQDVQKYTIVYVFGLIWVMFFFQGLGAYWISSTVAIWYFEQGNPNSPILRSICRSVKSMGSIVFGSLLLAIVTALRLILQYLNNKAKHSTMAMNEAQAGAMKFVLKCASCLIACFQRVIRFLTDNAYIMMAISGKNFCTSAQQSFYVVLRSAGQFAVSQGTTKLFMGIGKGFIVTVCCVVGYIFITMISPFKQQIYEPVFLTIIFAVASFPVASAFMTLFQMAANTLLVCYCIQLDIAKGRSKCPQGLKNFLEQYIQSSSIMNDLQVQNQR